MPPHFFKIVKRPNLRPEDMHDHIADIDRHPVGLIQSLSLHVLHALERKPVHQLVGQRAHMPGRSPRGDHHVIGKAAAIIELDGYDVFGLVCVQRLLNKVFDFGRRQRARISGAINGLWLLSCKGEYDLA